MQRVSAALELDVGGTVRPLGDVKVQRVEDVKDLSVAPSERDRYLVTAVGLDGLRVKLGHGSGDRLGRVGSRCVDGEALHLARPSSHLSREFPGEENVRLAVLRG